MAARRRPALVIQPEDARLLPPVAEALYRWFGARLLAATDVLIWPTADRRGIAEGARHVRLVFKGPALSIERNVYAKEMLPNQNLHTEITLQRALGFEVEAEGERGRVYGIKSELGRQLDEPDMPFQELLRVIGEYAAVALEKQYGTGVLVDVSLMPLEGAPLEPYYSARKRAWQPAGAPPPTLTRDPYDVEDVLGFGPRVDLCRMYPRVASCSRDVVAIRTAAPVRNADYFRSGGASGPMQAGDHAFFTTSRKNADFLVSHATMPSPEAAKLVKACGGWLFPSFGVGLVPSVTFGPLCLFASVDVVLSGLRPYRTGRGAWPIQVYDTDVWTMKSQHLDAAARILYQQLTGTYDEDEAGRYGAMGAGGAHQWILGAPTSLSSWGHEIEVTQILATATLASELAARWKIWGYRDDVDSEEILERYSSTKHRYPYLEAKANSLVDASCWQVAAAPRAWAAKSRAYMRETGIEAELLVVPDPAGQQGTEHWSLGPRITDTHAFSRVVAEAVVAFAQREGRVRSYL